MMNVATEFQRLRDLMPASGRMQTKLVGKSDRNVTIDAPFPYPWNRQRKIYINPTYWQELPQPERDLLALRTVCWVMGVRWFQIDVYRGAALAGIVASVAEMIQADPLGIVATGGLTALALQQIWKQNQSSAQEISADEAAIHVAQRRGYEAEAAAQALLQAIEHSAELEGRTSLGFTELLRCQNLRTIAKLSNIPMPDSFRNQA